MWVGKPEHSGARGPPALEGRLRQLLPRCPPGAGCCSPALGCWFPREGSSLPAASSAWKPLCGRGGVCSIPVLPGLPSPVPWALSASLPPGEASAGPGGQSIWLAWVSLPGAPHLCPRGSGNHHGRWGGWENSGLDHRGPGTAWPSQGPRVLLFLTGLYLQPLLFFNLASPPFIPLLKQEPRVLLTCGCHPSSERCWPSDGAPFLSSALTISCLH